ncbi:MAG: hypothetical protein R2755_01070 [Acidimicrobiales bacterium]
MTAAALTLAGCGQASDSVTSADRVSTAASLSPEVSAGPQQTTAPSTTAPAPTTSPTVAPTVAAPPTSGGSGEGTVTTLAPPESGQTLPTVVPTSAPDIATTAPTQPTSTTAPTPVTPPPAAGAVTITGVTCGNHPEENGDWVVFYMSGPPGAVNAAPAGAGVVTVSFAPATDATSGRLFNTSCQFVTEVVLATNADGSVVWNVLHTGSPRVETVAPIDLNGRWTYVVKLRG